MVAMCVDYTFKRKPFFNFISSFAVEISKCKLALWIIVTAEYLAYSQAIRIEQA